MEKNTKRAIAIGAGLLGLGALGYSALPSRDQTPEQEIERAEPLIRYFTHGELGVLRVDFYATPTQLSLENPSTPLTPQQIARKNEIKRDYPQYEKKERQDELIFWVKEESARINPTNDIAIFYENPSNLPGNKFIAEMKKGSNASGIYISPQLAKRLKNPEFRKSLEELINVFLEENTYKVMNETQYKTPLNGGFTEFGYSY